MTLHLAATLLLSAIACGDKDEAGGDDTAATDIFSEVITLTEETSGTLTCYTPGEAWITETPDASCQDTVTASGVVEDFETEDGVEDATVEIFFSDSVSGSADSVVTSDGDGNFSGATVPTCTPFSYQTSTDPDLDATKVTIEAHQIFDPLDKGETELDVTFNSVSSDTYAVIPALLGVSVDPELGIIAGTAYDCDGTELEGAQVIVRGADGEYAETQQVHYFVNDFPNRDQPYTSEDGLWVAINIPPGVVTVELWALSGGELVQIGATELEMYADVINISNIKIGYGDGVFYPTDCLSACQ
jgi:hypothetical protein